MAFVSVRTAPGLRAAAPAKSSRSSRPAAGVPSITARCRPFFSQPPRAFYRNAGVWDDAAADAMRVILRDMAKQWQAGRGSPSANSCQPCGTTRSGYVYGSGRCRPNKNSSQQQQQRQQQSSTPQLPLDVADGPEGFYTLFADIPGLSKPDLSIKLSKERVLTISGERTPAYYDASTPQQQERMLGSFERRWQLPEDAENEGISAKVADGVLTIIVPKKQPQPEPQDEQQDIFIA
uniref:SHSP domain-containing protein n=1 Tax=Tetradesmus obliquus TaxID=3088 RepID=A0A383W0F5_TETOB|eukprot:jgi/Sobl393_1/5991/SZX70971.1